MSAWEEHLAGLQKTGAITSRLFLNWPILLETQQALSKASGSTPRNRQVSPDVKRPDTDVQFTVRSTARSSGKSSCVK